MSDDAGGVGGAGAGDGVGGATGSGSLGGSESGMGGTGAGPSESDKSNFGEAMGGFGGLGIGNPGSYGGEQSVGAPGFDGGYSGTNASDKGSLSDVYGTSNQTKTEQENEEYGEIRATPELGLVERVKQELNDDWFEMVDNPTPNARCDVVVGYLGSAVVGLGAAGATIAEYGLLAYGPEAVSIAEGFLPGPPGTALGVASAIISGAVQDTINDDRHWSDHHLNDEHFSDLSDPDFPWDD
jgi:hypothetical protein